MRHWLGRRDGAKPCYLKRQQTALPTFSNAHVSAATNHGKLPKGYFKQPVIFATL
jgi:hypothetical protein